MLLNRLKKQYKRKHKIFDDRSLKRLISKAYNQLLNGEEIKWETVREYSNKNFSLNKLLVDLSLIKEIKRELNEIIDEIEDLNEKKIKVIYGEYGQGKSQTAQILQEWLNDDQKFPGVIPIYQCVSVLPKLFWYSSHQIKKKVLATSVIQELNLHLRNLSLGQPENFFTSPQNVQIPYLIDEFNNLMIKLTNFGYTTILILDELDKILTDPKNWKPWGDLFTSLKSDMSLLIIILIPQRIGQEILKTDPRMERWLIYFNFDATFLTGLVQDKVPEFVGNILAMSAVKNRLKLDKYLEFAHACVNIKKDWLESAKVRSVNIWSIHLAKILEVLVNINFERIKEKFYELSEQKRGLRLEYCIRTFLKSIQFPDLIQKMDDETQLYKSYYKNKNLIYSKKESDGQIRVEKIVNNQVVEYKEIAVEIKYTSQGRHSDEDVRKLQILSEKWPLIFVSIGSDVDYLRDLEQETIKWEKSAIGVIPNFPVLIVHIPNILYHLLLILEEDLKDQSAPKYLNLVKFWAEYIVNFLYLVQEFLTKLPELLIDRKMKIRLTEAKLLTGSQILEESYSSPSLGSQIEEQGIIISDGRIIEKKAISILCSFIDTKINKYKYWDNFQTGVYEDIQKNSPDARKSFDQNLEDWINTLSEKKMATKKERGTNFAIYKLENWNFSDALNLLDK